MPNYSQEYLSGLSKLVDTNIERILAHFNRKLRLYGDYYIGSCQVHMGDNPCSNIYYHNRSKWRCFTHQCEITFQKTSIGYIRGLLSSEKYGWRVPGNQTAGFNETINWINEFLGKPSIQDFPKEEKPKFEWPEPKLLLTKTEIRAKLNIPSNYFLNRGFYPETLDYYDVGPLKKPEKGLYFRELVPIYDLENKYCIGATCRSSFEKCPKCLCHHDLWRECPKEEIRHIYSKWRNWEFRKAYSLYNYWGEKDRLKKEKWAIIVEGPGNIWRLKEAGITNCLATYGKSLCFPQSKILEWAKVQHLFVGYDNDEAGKEGFNRLGQQYWQQFNIHKLVWPKEYNDLGEIIPWKIKEIIEPQLKIW